MLPTLTKAIGVEMIRDGGSYAATFHDKEGCRYVLFTRIQSIDRDDTTKERIGYEPPVLIDCDPAKRPTSTNKHVYSALSGPATAITWAEARTMMALAKGLIPALDNGRLEWLNQMAHVVTSDGGLPPDVDAIVHVKHPPGAMRNS